MKLIIVRHGESEWNRLNLFTGWTDVDLSDQGKQEAQSAGQLLKKEGYDFDVCYTSYLKRAIHTLNLILGELDREWLPVKKSWLLNERHYGALQGLNKTETAEKFGEEQVKIWRRSYDITPPVLEEKDARNPRNQEQYRELDKSVVPLTESLKDTVARVIPFFEQTIKEDMKQGKRVIIAAHGNSIRALVKYFDGLTEEEIISVNIPTGIPLVYEFDNDFHVTGKYYLGDKDAVEAKIKNVANQASKDKK
ncbi:2,3-bisphosphoglycerate-dependent phosphoglycerate mutase [Anaerocolumna jejuensis DSM 15929]|uniref:2,3-bisphosphoglycerate-dependent phosphoglycerate mutase n=1 Tax=Anaerocolumna jejuensis DSM 15929 TaxID=1121322 RepID=A0A1M6W3B7_9FIRM|nr:2,3-diphosphoglycerate-dependent phosphoglycerate mutase [Anaerocolumna jejuensis]SHK88138.1 2,3-bisphosphoglycerate-dependent phosphoglycerate mutase [Anaerocolumna jejuensis DSM 15929]